VIIIFKKIKWNTKYTSIAITFLAVLMIAILFEKILDNFAGITMGIVGFFGYLKHLAAPFLFGFAIAYLMHPCVKFLEKKFGKWSPFLHKHNGIKRSISIILTYVLVLGGISWILIYFIPEVISSLSIFYNQMPRHMSDLQITIQQIFDQISYIDADDVNTLINNLLQPIISYTKNVPLVLSTILDSTVIAASSLLNAIMGIFIAFYMLMDKEKFAQSSKKTIYALFDQNKADHFFYNIERIHGIFQNFIVGKTLDSTIIGILCFIGLSLIKAPYVTVVSLIIGITNMIPYFGPFIGAIPALLITLLIEPSKVIWVALFILGLQQFDGIILGPKILGDSTGMTPLWIILSIVVGGALMGPIGMFLGVPVIASIKMFWVEFIQKKYKEKYLYEDLPITAGLGEENKKDKE
jgi:predicted PurR-regulated permease PerM